MSGGRKKRVLFAVCGEGFGHVKSCLRIMELLSADHEVKALCWGKPLQYLKELGFDAVETFPDYETTFSRETVDLRKTLSVKAFLARTRKALQAEERIVREFRPDVIFSDSKISIVMVAQRHGIPCVVMCNQTSLHKKLPVSLSKLFVAPFIVVSFSIFSKFPALKKILIRDVPPPNDLSEGEVERRPWGKKLEYIGFTVPWVKARHKKARGRVVLCGLSGTGVGGSLLREIQRVANQSNYKFRVLGVGERKGVKSAKNFEVLPFVDERGLQREFENADVYLGLAGHTSITNALSLGVPVVTAYPRNHLEQMLNSLNCERQGVGLSLGSEPSTQAIKDALDSVFSSNEFFENAKRYQRLCEKHNGTLKAVKVVKGILNAGKGGPWHRKIKAIRVLRKKLRVPRFLKRAALAGK